METFKRIIMTVIFLPVLIFSLHSTVYQSLVFTLLITFIGMLGYYELRMLFLKKQYNHTLAIPIALICIYAAYYFEHYFLIGGIFTVIFIIETAYQLYSESDFEKSVFKILLALFILFYLGCMWGTSILLKRIVDISSENNFSGVIHYCILVTGTWMCDIGAYFVGKYFGKHKLNLPVSPKKSLEGFIGGIVISILSLYIICYFLHVSFSSFMILLPIATIIADLFESLLKRMVNEKDSSNLIPGHGGVLDTFDALIITTPLYYFVIMYFY